MASEALQEQLEISCQGCGAVIVVEADRKTARCPFCASPAVVERPATGDRPPPSFVVGLVVGHDRAVDLIRRWIRSRGPFTRSDFKAAVVKSAQAVYLPTYLYGAVGHSDYEAEIGENYTETYTTTDANGKTVTRTRTVTEWRHLSGRHSCYVLDVVVTASKGIGNEELEAVEPYDLRALRRYTPAMISGWPAEEPTLSIDECLCLAHDESLDKIGQELDDFMPGDSHRDLRYSTDLENEVIDQVLLPLWSCAVRYSEDAPPIRLLVNGQTGKVGGKVPISGLKILLSVLFVVAAIGVVYLVLREPR